MLKHFVLFVSFSFAFQLLAQQEPKMDMFWNNYLHTNPAMTGLQTKRFIGAQYRNQWESFNGNPQIGTIDYAERIAKVHGAIGASYEYDQIGFFKYNTGLIHYSFHIPIKNGVFALGLSAGLKQIDNRMAFQNGPNGAPAGITSMKEVQPQFDFGIAYSSNRLTLGLSSTQLNAVRYQKIGYLDTRHYWLNLEYRYALNENLILLPRVQAVSDLFKLSSTESLVLEFKQKCTAGLSISNIGWTSSNSWLSLGPTVGYVIANKWNVAYTWNIVVNQNLSSGILNTHEFALSYQIK